MEAKAKAKYIRVSPRKARQVVDLVKGKKVEEALNLLHFLKKAACRPVEKTLRSAVANALSAENSSKLDAEDLVVKGAYVDEGPTTKRLQPRAMGRATRIRHRTSHITIIVGTKKEDDL
ncbi:MAG TPA: 50S ribosomal protein L22 [Candidatus Latescibacteria bacterium]|nr:50S ribosomal protein L22 [Candidatus Latescibacterota bacterium]